MVKVPTPSARPYGIVVGPVGKVWVALVGTNKLASVDPDSLKLTEYALPDRHSSPRRIAATKAGEIYYVDFSEGRLGHLDPRTGKVREWPAPSGDGAGPYAMTIDEADRIWYVESGVRPNVLVGFDTKTGKYVSQTPIPSGGGSVRHMTYHKQTKSIWFGTDAGTLGRARLLD